MNHSIQQKYPNTKQNYNYFEERVKKKNYKALFPDEINDNEKLHLALAINFYTGAYSDQINRGASLDLRMANSIVVPQASIENEISIVSPLFYFLAKALSFLPCYYGTVTRSIDIHDSIAIYKPGNLICWLQFSSSAQGDKPPQCFKERKTWFHIFSLSGRSIKAFSNLQQQNEVLFLPCSTFLILKKQAIDGIDHIYMRQVELGIADNNVMWVDDKIFDKQYENKQLMEASIIQGRSKKIRFILKDSTELAMSYIMSDLGKLYLSNKKNKFRLISDMNRGLQQDAGAILLSQLALSYIRKLNYKCMIYTSNRQNAIQKLKMYLVEDQVKKILVSVVPQDVMRFLQFK